MLFLTKQLVYDQSLVQSVEAFQYSRGRGSVFIVYIDALEDTDLTQVEEIVTKTLNGLATGETPVDGETLSAILNNWEMNFLWGLEDIQEKAEALQRYHHYWEIQTLCLRTGSLSRCDPREVTNACVDLFHQR